VLVDHFGQDVKEISLLGGLPPTVEPDGVDGSLVRVTLPLVPGSSDWRPPHGDQSDSGYAPGPSQPSDIPGLVAWWKADALTLADDDPVATWPDSSGNGHDLAQATSDRRPTFKAGVLNGRPIVRFDGGDVLATSATSAPGNTFTLFAVAQVTSAGLRSIIDKDRNTTPRIFQFRWLGGNAELIGFNAVG